jgi:hypothetical protein
VDYCDVTGVGYGSKKKVYDGGGCWVMDYCDAAEFTKFVKVVEFLLQNNAY